MVMYVMLNGRRQPFLPTNPNEVVTSAMQNESLNRRMSGECLPAIAGVDKHLMAIVLKACAYLPKDRYRDADEMLQALQGQMKKTPPTLGKKKATEFFSLTLIQVACKDR